MSGVFLATLLLFSAPLAAQDEKPIHLNIGGGFTGVYGGASDRIGNGGSFTLGAIFDVNPVFAVQGEYGWNGFVQKQLNLPVSVTPNAATVPTKFFADGNMQYGDLNALLSPHVQGKAKPYFLTGLGVYYRPVQISTPAVGFVTACEPYWYVCYPTPVEVENVIGSRSSTDFGMNFGGGLNLRVAEKASVYFEVRYHYIWGPKIASPSGEAVNNANANGKFLPITIGFRF